MALSHDQLDTFRTRGLLHLPGLIPAAAIARAHDSILRPLERLGLWRDGVWRLDEHPRPVWPDKGVSAKQIGNRHPGAEALADEPAVRAVVDALLEGESADRTIYKRPQILVTLPNATCWSVPQGWHVDVPRFASGRWPGVQLFYLLAPVLPGAGGTLVLAGGHRLLNDQGYVRIRDVGHLLRRHPAVRDVLAPGPLDSRADAPGGALRSGMAGDVAVELVELTGEAGDVYAMDLRMLHVPAPNAGVTPRLMATDRYLRASVVQEFVSVLSASPGGM